MPKSGMVWRQVIISTLSSWLPGDERGWRSRDHKRHSSGDYKNPPPKDEHKGLRRYVSRRARSIVKISWELRARIGVEVIKQFLKRGYRVLCASVSERHVHVLVELPFDLGQTKRIVGLCKGASSHALRDVMPGSIWAEGGKYKLVVDEEHHRNVFGYILYEQGSGAYTWSYKDARLEFVPGRKRPAWYKKRGRRRL